MSGEHGTSLTPRMLGWKWILAGWRLVSRSFLCLRGDCADVGAVIPLIPLLLVSSAFASLYPVLRRLWIDRLLRCSDIDGKDLEVADEMQEERGVSKLELGNSCQAPAQDSSIVNVTSKAAARKSRTSWYSWLEKEPIGTAV